MTGTPAPLPPDLVDELLSAELDGELAAAARDLGLDPEDVRARLAATPGVAARRSALDRSRSLLAVDGLEPGARDRVLDAARAAAAGPHAVDVLADRRRTRARVATRFLSAAAALVLVLGVAAVVATRDDRDIGTTAAGPDAGGGDAATESAASAAVAVELGDVTEPEALRDAVTPLLASPPARPLAAPDLAVGETAPEQDDTSFAEDPEADVGDEDSGTGAGGDGGSDDSGVGGADDASDDTGDAATLAGVDAVEAAPDGAAARTTAPPSCTAAKAEEFDVGPGAVLEATAEYHDRPVEIAVFAVDGGHFVVVSDAADDCATVAVQTLRPGE